MTQPRILILSSSLLTERMFLHSSFGRTIAGQAQVHL
ncbi:MAG: hypothetical protein RIR86_1670, partial [Acidobacteriota bacterium]